MTCLISKMNLLVIALLLVPLSACSSEDHHHHEDHYHEDHHHEGDSVHAAAKSIQEKLANLHLNNEEKWKMDDHTRESFEKMANYFSSIDIMSLSEDDLKAAGEHLQNGINELVTGCTMQGEAHDQLHVFLLSGYIPAVAELYETGDIKTAEEVRGYLEIYDEYFE